MFECLYCCFFLLQSVPGLSSQHKTHGDQSWKGKSDRYPHQPRSFHPRDHKSTCATRQKIHQQPHAEHRQPSTCHQTTRSRHQVISSDQCHTQYIFCRSRVCSCEYRPNGNPHSVFSLMPTTTVLCGPAAISLYPTTMGTTLTTTSSSCSMTSTLRQHCAHASPKLMSSAAPLDSDSPWTFSQFHSNILLHLVLSHHLLVLWSNFCFEVVPHPTSGGKVTWTVRFVRLPFPPTTQMSHCLCDLDDYSAG